MEELDIELNQLLSLEDNPVGRLQVGSVLQDQGDGHLFPKSHLDSLLNVPEDAAGPQGEGVPCGL